MPRDQQPVLITAFLLDALLGEPPNQIHPVAWMGRIIVWARKSTPKKGRLLYGSILSWGGACVVWWLASHYLRFARSLPLPLNWLLQGTLMKMTFSLRGLDQAAAEVEHALLTGNLALAKEKLSWHLVSRDVSGLDEAQVAAAAIESVAENTSDGIIAPLLFYLVGGLPAALSYRYINTVDSMLGYRDDEREWLGKIPARTDDLLNLIPARLTALLILAASKGHGWQIWWRDASKTASPNAGHPMSAMAGALDVELEKVDHYVLGSGGKQPDADDLRESRRLFFAAIGLLLLLISLLPTGKRHAYTDSS